MLKTHEENQFMSSNSNRHSQSPPRMDMSPGGEMKTTEIHDSPGVRLQVPSEPEYSDKYSDGDIKSAQKSRRSGQHSPTEPQDVFDQ